jgi:hypothetical protein
MASWVSDSLQTKSFAPSSRITPQSAQRIASGVAGPETEALVAGLEKVTGCGGIVELVKFAEGFAKHLHRPKIGIAAAVVGILLGAAGAIEVDFGLFDSAFAGGAVAVDASAYQSLTLWPRQAPFFSKLLE